jgi:hypothetical protein
MLLRNGLLPPVGVRHESAVRKPGNYREDAGLAALEARDAAERQAQLRHAPGKRAPERPTPACDPSEDVIHLRLPAPEQPARDRATSEDVIHLHLGA